METPQAHLLWAGTLLIVVCGQLASAKTGTVLLKACNTLFVITIHNFNF